MNLLRPETYIRSFVAGGSGWKPLLPTPQFPTYISGHSTQSGASAVLMTSSFGNSPFTDDTKTRRGFLPRSFANFTAAAQEAAISRLYGGIHYPMDNSNGVSAGQCVGNTILSRVSLAL
jgi:membrane-associated phospholipid phosphatase